MPHPLEPPKGYIQLEDAWIKKLNEFYQGHRDIIDDPFFRNHYCEELLDECFDHTEFNRFWLVNGECRDAIALHWDKLGNRFFLIFPEPGDTAEVLLVYYEGDAKEGPHPNTTGNVAHALHFVLESEVHNWTPTHH